MTLNRAHLRRAVRSVLMGQGAVRWLSPRLRKRFGLALFFWGLVGGVALGVLHEYLRLDVRTLWVEALVGFFVLVPFLVYEVMLSYLLLERRDRESELEVAARIQAGLLPETVPVHPQWECAGRYRPARAVGGDCWEVLVLPDGRWLLVVADVSGKGVPAAILMAGLRARLHLLAEQDPDPGRLAKRLNDALTGETEPTEFSTLLLVLLDPASATFTYVNAGHPPGLLCRVDGTLEQLPARGIPVGMLEDAEYASRTATWRPGDGLLLYSDGALDAAIDRHDPLEPEDLAAAVTAARPATAADMADAVLARVDALVGGGEAEDDVTVVACLFRADAPAAN
jgi:sigma-B regulation protein RsbU (phosphoserine phosphatase)